MRMQIKAQAAWALTEKHAKGTLRAGSPQARYLVVMAHRCSR